MLRQRTRGARGICLALLYCIFPGVLIVVRQRVHQPNKHKTFDRAGKRKNIVQNVRVVLPYSSFAVYVRLVFLNYRFSVTTDRQQRIIAVSNIWKIQISNVYFQEPCSASLYTLSVKNTVSNTCDVFVYGS